LGLAISERIARLIDAKIEVASMLGRGSTFTLRVKASDAPASPPGEERTADPSALAGLCVVVVDNDPQVRNALQSLLRSWNCIAIAAPSAKAAISELRAARQSPQIIIADYRLDGDALGTDAVAALRETFAEDAAALIISSDPSEELKGFLKRRGLVFLAKPTAPMKLRALLTSLAEKRTQLG
jgi:CheY-like chemotaxis protein